MEETDIIIDELINELDNEVVKDDLVKLDINDLLSCLAEHKLEKEFKKFVNKTLEERRENSSIIALRDLHNWIKRTLIESAVTILNKKVNLLDIAVGRGGDIDKWVKAGSGGVFIQKVFGFDSSETSINSEDPFNPGAIQRLANYKKDNKTKIHFEVGNAMVPTNQLLDNIEKFLNKQHFQIVSCQFAIHYFFKSYDSLKYTFQIANKYTDAGAIFMVTTMDSAKIRSFFTKRISKEYDSQLFNIQIDKWFTREPYGNKYTFLIKDTFDQGNYFNTMGPSVEYLVDQQELERVALMNGFIPYDKNLLESYKSNNKIEFSNNYTIKNGKRTPNNAIPFRDIVRLWKPKPGKKNLSKEELELNDLYTVYLFRKR